MPFFKSILVYIIRMTKTDVDSTYHFFSIDYMDVPYQSYVQAISLIKHFIFFSFSFSINKLLVVTLRV